MAGQKHRSQRLLPPGTITPGALLRSMFVPPFQRHGGSYVFDAAGCMVACPAELRGTPFIPRGWGRIQYHPDGDRAMDEWERVFSQVVAGETDPDVVVRLLNEAAEVGP